MDTFSFPFVQPNNGSVVSVKNEPVRWGEYIFVCGETQTMEWLLLLLLLLLALLSYYQIYARYAAEKLLKNNSVDTSDTRYCAKFCPFGTSNYAKNDFAIFCDFAIRPT